MDTTGGTFKKETWKTNKEKPSAEKQIKNNLRKDYTMWGINRSHLQESQHNEVSQL